MIQLTTSYEKLPYKTSVPVRGKLIVKNNFLKVTLLEKDYFISILPGFHQATLEEIEFKIKYLFSHYVPDFNSINFGKKLFNLFSMDSHLEGLESETLFNIENLLLGMIKTTHPELFSNELILTNELYRPTWGPSGYLDSDCLKIKITTDSGPTISKLIKELHENNPGLLIRLDGNRSFEIDDLIIFERTLKKNLSEESFAKIDYIEEPLKNFSDALLFKRNSTLTIAMDESFKSYINGPENIPKDCPIVIKPSLHGISSIYNWIQIHSKNRIIVSSSFEHPSVRIGLDMLARLNPLEFHGLENFF